MKIIGVGMNYRPHCSELHNEVPGEPVLFLKPDSALAGDSMPFFLPDFSEEIHYEAELVVRISKLGKNISEKFAHRYYDQVSVGLDLTARDLQRDAREKGLPWAVSKGFDQSAVTGRFVSLEGKDIQSLSFRLDLNGQTVQQGFSGDMIFPVDRLVAYASRFFTLKTGDLIFTGTPAGVGPIHIGDTLEGWLEDEPLLRLRVK